VTSCSIRCESLSAMHRTIGVFRTATPVLNGANWRYSVSRSELGASFLNGAQRSVNRKVQGSNPSPGAKSEYGLPHPEPWAGGPYYNRTTNWGEDDAVDKHSIPIAPSLDYRPIENTGE
jgi:hypothetical protein